MASTAEPAVVGQREFRALLGSTGRALSALGLWRDPPAPGGCSGGGGGGWRRSLAAAAVVAAFALTATSALLKLCFDTPEDLEELTMAVFVCTGATAAGAKAVLFVVHRPTTQRLVLRLLEARVLFPEDGAGARTRYQRTAERIALGYQVAVMVPALLWVATPAVVAALSAPVAANGTAAAAPRGTPLPLWAPFDWQRSPRYELVYAAQAAATATINLAGLLLDVFFVTLMLRLTAELAVLSRNMAAMRPSPADAPGGDCTVKPGSRSHMYRLLVDNIRHHQLIIMCVGDLERAMSQSIFIILLTNVINICSQAFASAVLFRRGVDWGLVTKMLFTFVAYMFETGMFCVFGQAITDQSERLSQAAAGCGWLEADAASRRALLPVLAQAGRPLALRVGTVTALGKAALLQLLNMSYTTFNVLFELQGAD